MKFTLVPALATLSFGLTSIASAQVIPITSAGSARNLPSIEHVYAHKSEQTTYNHDCSAEKTTFHKGTLIFNSDVQELLEKLLVSTIDANFSESTVHIAYEGPQQCQQQQQCGGPGGEHTSNRELTRVSLVKGISGIMSLKEAFSFPEVQSALLRWSNGSPLLLIDGGKAWDMVAKLPVRFKADREYFEGSSHETDLFTDGKVICTLESNKHKMGEQVYSSREEMACLVPLFPNKVGTFEMQRVQQQQQQRQVQPPHSNVKQNQQRQQAQTPEQRNQQERQQIKQREEQMSVGQPTLPVKQQPQQRQQRQQNCHYGCQTQQIAPDSSSRKVLNLQAEQLEQMKEAQQKGQQKQQQQRQQRIPSPTPAIH